MTNILSLQALHNHFPTSGIAKWIYYKGKIQVIFCCCRNGIQQQPVVTGYGYNSTVLLTHQQMVKPDRNGNFRPDDKGESQATTFSISMTADPPCSVINNVLYNTDFGAGSGNSMFLPAGITNEYAFGINPMDEETYVLTDNANKGNSTQYVNLADHTGNTNGKMLLVNADVNNYRLFQTTVSVCSNLPVFALVLTQPTPSIVPTQHFAPMHLGRHNIQISHLWCVMQQTAPS